MRLLRSPSTIRASSSTSSSAKRKKREVVEISEDAVTRKGWLYKWTNRIKGYQKRWFIVSDEILVYFLGEGNAHARGWIRLQGSTIYALGDGVTFAVSSSEGETFKMRAAEAAECRRWMEALSPCRRASGRQFSVVVSFTAAAVTWYFKTRNYMAGCIVSDDVKVEPTISEDVQENEPRSLPALIDEISGCTERIVHQEAVLRTALSDLDMDGVSKRLPRKWRRTFRDGAKTVRDRMNELDSMTCTLTKVSAVLRQEYGAATREPETVRPSCSRSLAPPSQSRGSLTSDSSSTSATSSGYCAEATEGNDDTDSSEDDYHDAVEEVAHDDSFGDGDEGSTEPMESSADSADAKVAMKPKRQRRKRIPDSPNKKFSVWSFIKNNIGKDFAKSPLPVNLNEPMSLLQRLAEQMLYSDLLYRASRTSEDLEQMCLLGAFAVSVTQGSISRSGKPFNPLLGETFECDRTEDYGWWAVAEQVSHHPPVAAIHYEASDGSWTCWEEVAVNCKFRGKYLEVCPLGIIHVFFPGSENHYTFPKATTHAHNIVFGELFLDAYGEANVTNHKTNDRCLISYEGYSFFSGQSKRFYGAVTDGSRNGAVKYAIEGNWMTGDGKLEASPVTSVPRGEFALSPGSFKQLKKGPPKTLWKSLPMHPGAEKYYGYTQLACELNEPEAGVAPTDSRHRTDQRMMEDGDWEGANFDKIRLENKQRATRRAREAAEAEGTMEPYSPLWFKQAPDAQNGDKPTFTYAGGYWEAKREQNWDQCPDIF